MNFFSSKHGFTLLEGVVVMAITALIASVVVPFYGLFQIFSYTDSVKNELLANLRVSQARSQAREGNLPFGVYLEPGKYTLYQGNSFVTRESDQDEIFSLENVVLSWSGFTVINGVVDLQFAPSSGIPTNSGIIILSHSGGKNRFLSINSLGVISEARPTTLRLYPIADSRIIQGSGANTNYGNDVFIQTYPFNPGYNRRSLIRFDFTSLPSGSIIQDAQLFLYGNRVYNFNPRIINLHRVTKDWRESEVTWNRYQSVSLWTTAGGDFISTPSASQTLQWDYVPEWNSWNVAEDVHAFVSQEVANYGWLIKDQNEDSSQEYWNFSSKDGANNPYLLIEYFSS